MSLRDPVTGQRLHAFEGHTEAVRGACVVPVGPRCLLASAGDDGTVRLWDPGSGLPERVLDGMGPVTGVAGAPGAGGQLLASTSRDGSVRLWHLGTGARPSRLAGHTGAATRLCPVTVEHRQLLASAGQDRCVRLWDLDNRRLVRTLTGDYPAATDLCAVPGPDGDRLAVASDSVRLWQPATGQIERVFSHLCWVTAVCPEPVPEGTLLASADEDGVVRLWDPATGALARELRSHYAAATALCAVPGGGRHLLASASADRTIAVWDPETGERVAALPGHTAAVTGLCTVSAGGENLLVSTGADRTARLWDPVTGSLRLTIPTYHRALACWSGGDADPGGLVLGLDQGLLALGLDLARTGPPGMINRTEVCWSDPRGRWTRRRTATSGPAGWSGPKHLVPATPPQPARRTVWVHNVARPVREFVATEIGSAVILLAATLAALAWANSPWGASYEHVWTSELSIALAGSELSLELREWINDGLMAFFFFVIGLEIRRELDLGELRDRRRAAVPVVAAIGGMAVPALLYLAFNAGTEAVHGWGVVMATDTAFALGVLALVGRRWPLRVRVFLLTLVVVDDVGALTVIALVYTEDLSLVPLLVAVALFGVVFGLRSAGVRRGEPYLLLGVGLWLALLHSGVHPTIAGVAMGLLATAYPPSRTDLGRAASLWRTFREQPTPRFARSASQSLREAISPNERLQLLFHPWTSFVIVPLFALANAGVQISGELLGQAVTSPITLGILVGLVVGKLVGITAASWLVTRRRFGGLPLTVPLPPLVGVAAIAGIGFTVSLFIAEFSFTGTALDEARLGILAATILATGLAWVVFRVIDRLPARVQQGGRNRPAEALVDLVDPVDPERDHIRGPVQGAGEVGGAPVTLVEYGDFQCRYCGQAEPVIRELLAQFGADLRYVFRHLPLVEVHEHAQLAAEAAEAADAQGAFWEMHDLLYGRQDALGIKDLIGYARELGLDVERFTAKLKKHTYGPRVAQDVESADRSGVTGTPTFFANGRRYHGAFDLDSLATLVESALTQAEPPALTDRG